VLVGTCVVLASAVTFPLTASSAPPVRGLESCTPSANCHFGPVYDHFPNYRSVCLDENCFFITAANWVQVVMGTEPKVSLVRSEYQVAGMNYRGGRTVARLWDIWRKIGVLGTYLKSTEAVATSMGSIERSILKHRALVAECARANTTAQIGSTPVSTASFLLVADGYTPKGPLVVYQSETIQMTWAQWRDEVRRVWAVVDSDTGTATGSPIPTTTVPS
jgi:hypothetical protein